MDNALMDGFPGITFAFHLCRGNQHSRWLVEGGYNLIARPIFQGIKAQRLMLEYDDQRSGTFEPLREVPDDKMVILGLVTTQKRAPGYAGRAYGADRGGQPLCAARAIGH